ncbi:MAG: mannonate dehydratase [Clostridiales bacterium]|nr:mannonate dehydratase [Clostridiales bacterium]
MKIASHYFGTHHEALNHYACQMGIDSVVCTVPFISGQPDYVHPWDKVALRAQQQAMETYGLKICVLEGIKFIDSVKLGRPDKDLCIENFCQLIRNMADLGINTICYNWMPVFGWFRTRHAIPSRGGALVTGFSSKDIDSDDRTIAGEVTEKTLWENLKYFMESVVPVAEKYKVKLALHPDDPPIASLSGISRILISPDAMERAINMVPSPYNGITMCQGTFATMGADIPIEIHRFGERIFFAHFRDVRGNANEFIETFPDDGKTDMYKVVRAYRDIDFDGIIRIDHMPTLYGESNTNPGYATLGWLYAFGYLRGLMEAVNQS